MSSVVIYIIVEEDSDNSPISGTALAVLFLICFLMIFLLKKGPFNMFLLKKYLQLILIKANS